MNSGYKDFFDKAQKTKGIKQSPNPIAIRARGNVRRPIRKINKKAIFLTSIGFLITLVGTFFIDEIEKFSKKVDVSFFGRAHAEEKAPAKENTGDSKKDAVAKSGEAAEKKEGTSQESSKTKEIAQIDENEINHFARLRERKVELDHREEEITKMETELAQQKQEVEVKLKELEEVRRKISSVLEEKVQVDEQKVENLVQFYSNMKPPQAAKIIETIDENLAVQVIAKMKKKNAADIMNLLPPEKAQMISEKYVGYRK